MPKKPQKNNKSKSVTAKIGELEKVEIARRISYEFHPDQITREFKKLVGKTGKKKGADFTKEKNKEILGNMAMVLGLETHVPLLRSVTEEYRPLMVEISNCLQNEFKCETTSEKMLVHLIANAYFRINSLTGRMVHTMELDRASPTLNGFYTVLSKELDRAGRQFTSALLTLRQLKNPHTDIKLKANVAFVAQNQQLNTCDKQHSYEINDPK